MQVIIRYKIKYLCVSSNIDQIIEIKFLEVVCCNSSICYNIQCVEFASSGDPFAYAYVGRIVTEHTRFWEVELKVYLECAVRVKLQGHALHELSFANRHRPNRHLVK